MLEKLVRNQGKEEKIGGFDQCTDRVGMAVAAGVCGHAARVGIRCLVFRCLPGVTNEILIRMGRLAAHQKKSGNDPENSGVFDTVGHR